MNMLLVSKMEKWDDVFAYDDFAKVDDVIFICYFSKYRSNLVQKKAFDGN